MEPDWTQAPKEATHYDSAIDMFCTVDGFWRPSGEYQAWSVPRPEVKTANTGQWLPRPSDTEYTDVSAPDFLRAALSHMQDRAATYDRPTGERSIGRATDAFKAITGDGKMDSDERGWLFMVLLKLARTQQGDYRADNYEDGAAYVALMGEAAAREKGND